VKVFRRDNVHCCSLERGDTTEKDAAMTMLNNTSSYPETPVAFPGSIRILLLRLGRSIDAVLFPGEQRASRQWAMVRSSAAWTPKKTGQSN